MVAPWLPFRLPRGRARQEKRHVACRLPLTRWRVSERNEALAIFLAFRSRELNCTSCRRICTKPRDAESTETSEERRGKREKQRSKVIDRGTKDYRSIKSDPRNCAECKCSSSGACGPRTWYHSFQRSVWQVDLPRQANSPPVRPNHPCRCIKPVNSKLSPHSGVALDEHQHLAPALYGKEDEALRGSIPSIPTQNDWLEKSPWRNAAWWCVVSWKQSSSGDLIIF